MESEFSSITARFNSVVEYLVSTGAVSNRQDFANKLGKKPSQISEIRSGKRPITHKFVNHVVNIFPEINPLWLVFGTGDMLLRGEESGAVGEIKVISSEELDELAHLRGQVATLKQILSQIIETKDKRIEELVGRLARYEGSESSSDGVGFMIASGELSPDETKDGGRLV